MVFLQGFCLVLQRSGVLSASFFLCLYNIEVNKHTALLLKGKMVQPHKELKTEKKGFLQLD